MKTILSITLCVFFSCCSEKESVTRVEAWQKLDRPSEQYQELQPNRPILILYTAKWDLMGHLALNYLNEPRFFDLLTHYQVLPLIADCTDQESIAAKSFESTHPEKTCLHCFHLHIPSQSDSWFPLDMNSSDSLYQSLATQFQTKMPNKPLLLYTNKR